MTLIDCSRVETTAGCRSTSVDFDAWRRRDLQPPAQLTLQDFQAIPARCSCFDSEQRFQPRRPPQLADIVDVNVHSFASAIRRSWRAFHCSFQCARYCSNCWPFRLCCYCCRWRYRSAQTIRCCCCCRWVVGTRVDRCTNHPSEWMAMLRGNSGQLTINSIHRRRQPPRLCHVHVAPPPHDSACIARRIDVWGPFACAPCESVGLERASLVYVLGKRSASRLTRFMCKDSLTDRTRPHP